MILSLSFQQSEGTSRSSGKKISDIESVRYRYLNLPCAHRRTQHLDDRGASIVSLHNKYYCRSFIRVARRQSLIAGYLQVFLPVAVLIAYFPSSMIKIYFREAINTIIIARTSVDASRWQSRSLPVYGRFCSICTLNSSHIYRHDVRESC